MHQNAVGNYAFELIDTPGTDSNEDAYRHAYFLKEALTARPINAILVVIKYQNRFEQILNNYLQDQRTIDKFDKKIIVIVTHCDTSKNFNSEKIEIQKVLEEWCSNVIFTGLNSNWESISDTLFRYLYNMNQEKLIISDEEFHLKFNIASLPMKRIMIDEYNELKLQLNWIDRNLKELVTTSLSEISNSEETDNFLQSVIIEYKNQTDDELKKFQEKFADFMINHDSYCLYIKFQKEILEKNDMFQKFAFTHMSYKPDDPSDPKNLYKRCPNCLLVWVKVTGCNNVQCGNRETSPDIKKGGAFQKYVFQRFADGFKYVRQTLSNQNVQTQPMRNYTYPGEVLSLREKISLLFEVIIEESANKGDKITTPGKGCGISFNWQTEAICLKEEEILEIYKAKSIEEVRQIINRQNFKELTRSYEDKLKAELNNTGVYNNQNNSSYLFNHYFTNSQVMDPWLIVIFIFIAVAIYYKVVFNSK